MDFRKLSPMLPVWLGCVALALVLLFPPWVQFCILKEVAAQSRTRGFVFCPPKPRWLAGEPHKLDGLFRVELDTGRLLAELGAIVFLTAAAYLPLKMLGKKPRDHDE